MGDTHQAIDRAIAEAEIREHAEALGYQFHVLTDSTIVLESSPDPDCCKTCDERQRTAVVALLEPDELDDDGQLWFDDFDVRVDTTGRGPAAIYVRKNLVDVDALSLHARALLSAVAAARSAER